VFDIRQVVTIAVGEQSSLGDTMNLIQQFSFFSLKIRVISKIRSSPNSVPE